MLEINQKVYNIYNKRAEHLKQFLGQCWYPILEKPEQRKVVQIQQKKNGEIVYQLSGQTAITEADIDKIIFLTKEDAELRINKYKQGELKWEQA